MIKLVDTIGNIFHYKIPIDLLYCIYFLSSFRVPSYILFIDSLLIVSGHFPFPSIFHILLLSSSSSNIYLPIIIIHVVLPISWGKNSSSLPVLSVNPNLK